MRGLILLSRSSRSSQRDNVDGLRQSASALDLGTIRIFAFAVLALATVMSAAPVCGHGVPIHIDGGSGTLVVSDGLALSGGYVDWAFDPSEESGLDFPSATVRTDSPGYDVTGVPDGATLQLELLARPDHSTPGRPARWLWFWDPGSDGVREAANDPDFRFRRLDLLGSLTIDQFTPPASVLMNVTESLTPDSHVHYVRYELDNSPPAAFGVYGVFARVRSPGFEPSAPFLMAFGYGVLSDAYEEGARAINAAAGLAGDFNADGTVDGGDLLTWQRTVGSSGGPGAYAAGDGTLDGWVDGADLALWRDSFGEFVVYPPVASPAIAAPEPSSLGAMATTCLGLFAASRRRGFARQRALTNG